MEFNEIISQLKDKYGDKIDVAHITEKLKGVDTSKMNLHEIVEKVKGGIGNVGKLGSELAGDFDGDGKKENLIDELKGKAASIFGK